MGTGIFCLMLLTTFQVQNLNAQAPAALTVSGNKVLTGGQVTSFAGNSFFWSNDNWGGEKFYNASCVTWLKNDWKSKIVRAAMGVDETGGYLSNPAGNKQKVKTVVDAAIANNMYVIIDWHTHNAQNYQSQAISFFQEMASTYGNTTNVIYEIYNEPLQVSWSGVIKPYAMAVIAAIRAIDPDNLIIVGTPSWSQNVDEASWDKISGYSNIAYTLHFYAGSHTQWLRDKAVTAMNNGIALFVTEWGTVNADGGGSVAYGETDNWVSFMKQYNLSNCNWSLNDKAEGASALNPGASSTGGWTASNLTASGTLVRNIIQGWPGGGGNDNCTNYKDITSTIQAENYCQMSGIQTENTSDADGGQNVGWIDANDWMTYAVNVTTAGTYTVNYRVASLSGGGSIQLEKAGGAPVYGTVSIPSTGGWQTWTTVSHNVTLPAGNQLLAIKAVNGGFNLNWWGQATTGGGNFSQTIQAESYAAMSGVQTESTSDAGGGLNVGWIDANDWMSYTNTVVNIPASGTYTVEYRVASLNGGGNLQFEESGGSTVYGTINIAATGGWQTWNTVKHTVTLSAGSHTFGIKALAGGWNLNWLTITQGLKSANIANGISNITSEKLIMYPNPAYNKVYVQCGNNENLRVQLLDLSGKQVLFKNIDTTNPEINISSLNSGIYIVRVSNGEKMFTEKLIKR